MAGLVLWKTSCSWFKKSNHRAALLRKPNDDQMLKNKNQTTLHLEVSLSGITMITMNRADEFFWKKKVLIQNFLKNATKQKSQDLSGLSFFVILHNFGTTRHRLNLPFQNKNLRSACWL